MIYDQDLITEVTNLMCQQMVIRDAIPQGFTFRTIVTATSETELDPIYHDLFKQLYNPDIPAFTTFAEPVYKYLGDGAAKPHEFTFHVGDFIVPVTP